MMHNHLRFESQEAYLIDQSVSLLPLCYQNSPIHANPLG